MLPRKSARKSRDASSIPSSSFRPQPGHVYLAGAGPGSPDLLTRRTLHLLEQATHVFPDDLVSPDILTLAQPGATVVAVGKRCGRARVTQSEINALLIAAARSGGIVLRLKSGDPLIFGRAAEEMAALRTANIPFEIVPGITAASAAAAALQVPLTDRSHASQVIFATAHHAQTKREAGDAPKPIWSGALAAESTLVIYMPGSDLQALASRLMGDGLAPETPCALVSRVSTPHQSIFLTTLAALGSQDAAAAPALLIVGEILQHCMDD